jgi:hypothetical protein
VFKKLGKSRYGNYIRISDEFMIRERLRYGGLKTRYYILTKKKDEKQWKYLSSLYNINGLRDALNLVDIENLKGCFLFALGEQVRTLTITEDKVIMGDVVGCEI